MNSRLKILVIDDQIGVQDSVDQKAFLRSYSALPFEFLFESCADGTNYRSERAVEVLRGKPDIDLVLLDIKFGAEKDRLGFEILPRLTSQFPHVPVVMMSSVERDIEALGRSLEDGAVGFVAKSQWPDKFQKSIQQAFSIARSHVLLGQSLPLRELRRQAARLSPYDQIPVIIIGERGTGKERVARYIHQNGPRSHGPFIPVNCAGLPDSLLEAEVFGAEKGAYTGALTTRIGYLERANRGVLFLDEIGNMPPTTQARLLRVLQDKSFRRLGVTREEIAVDFQLISATNEEPEELSREGRLRDDFYDRIAAATVRTPPLRECLSDIPELAHHFLRELGISKEKTFAPKVMEVFSCYAWPGNMRELRRIIQQAVVVSENSPVIELKHIPGHLRSALPQEAIDSSAVRVTAFPLLPDDPSEWSRARLLAELRLAIEAKKRIQRYKGKQWKAEFMRLMYPEYKAQSAKGFDDLVRRITHGPWGSSKMRTDLEFRQAIAELMA
jgi:DNA-binding NtrC family response regulator